MRNITKIHNLLFLLFFSQAVLHAQDLSGTWQGRFSLAGSARNWSFEIDLQQDHSKITGVGKQIELSKIDNTKNINSTFTIEGSFSGQYLIYDMQEIVFLKSSNGQCLAHCEYELVETPSKYQFIGECNRNGTFYKNEQYFSNHVACRNPIKTQVIFEKAKDINGRKTEVVESVRVNDSKVTIHLWDNDKVDGDIVSLNLNGVWLLKNYRLTKQIKTITFDLPKDSNELILYAENLGAMPPNTAAVSIWNGKEKLKTLQLNSDEGRSEGIRLLKK